MTSSLFFLKNRRRNRDRRGEPSAETPGNPPVREPDNPLPKVLLVSESESWSGGTAQLLSLAEGLKNSGWDVRVSSRPKSVIALKAGDIGVAFFPLALREDYDLISAWRLAQYVRSNAVEIVHAQHNRAHAVCLLSKLILGLMGRSVVLIVSRRVSFSPAKNPPSLWKYKSALIDRYIAVASGVKDVLTRSGIPAEKISVIHSGFDAAKFAPRPPETRLKEELGIAPDVPVIGKIANAAPWKGQATFLEAAALVLKNRPAHFLLVGRDTQSPWVKDAVERLGLSRQTSLAGFRTDIPDILSILRVSVNAAREGEGLSGALRESLAMGIPVAASDVAGNRELLSDGLEDFIFPPGDAPALAERILKILDQREAVGSKVEKWRRRRLDDFTLAHTISQTKALYLKLLGR